MGATVNQEYGVTKECKRAAASRAPFAYAMKTRPSTYRVGGKAAAGKDQGGNMNGGGKRRGGKLN